MISGWFVHFYLTINTANTLKNEPMIVAEDPREIKIASQDPLGLLGGGVSLSVHLARVKSSYRIQFDFFNN